MAHRIFRKYTPESTFELDFDLDDGYTQSKVIEGLGLGSIGTYLWYIGEILDCSELGYHEITDMDAFTRVEFDEEQKALVARQAKRETKGTVAQVISLKPKKSDAQVEEEARAILDGIAEDTGDDTVIDRIIQIVHTEGLDVCFSPSQGKLISPDVAYRLRYERALDIREPS